MFHKVVNGLEREYLFNDQEKNKIKGINMRANGSKTYLMERDHSILQTGILFQADL